MIYYIESSDFPASFHEALGLLPVPPGEQPACCLTDEAGALMLQVREGTEVMRTSVDFSDPALLYRLDTSGKRQGLGQAVGLKRYGALSILDCTAGLGRDAFILAGLGCRVTMLERHPVVHALLADGLRRGQESEAPRVRDVCSRLELVHADACKWLQSMKDGEVPDAIYLDPMFPERRKSAKVKKDMAGLQQLVGPDTDILQLLELARTRASKRVVVKRPRSNDESWLEGRLRHDFRISGKAMQFDVFLPA